jgi:hypothetical protein
VIKNDHDDGQRPDKIEPGLALSILEPWIKINLKRRCRFARHTKKRK